MTVELLVRQIREYPAADHGPAVERLVDHDDPGIRMRAVEVAVRLEHPRLAELCASLLVDPVWYVRCAACEGIYLVALAVPTGLLLKLVESDPNEIVRSWAALALGRVAGAGDVQRMLALAEIVQGENHEGTPVRETLLRAVEETRARG